MLAIYLATGIVGAAVVDPEVPVGEGALVAVEGQVATVRKLQSTASVASNVPYGAAQWTAPFDPSDRAPYAWDFSELLDGEAQIADIISLTVSAQGVAVGLEIDSAEGRNPIITTDGKFVQVYFLVNDEFQANVAFINGGVKLGVAAKIQTNEAPFEQYERTAVLNVRQL